jgi:hypothetical protein
MSPTSLEALAKQHPEHKRALSELNTWLSSHASLVSIDPKSLARDLSSIDKSDLAAALMLLVRAGLLQQVYKVLTPSGVMADAEFDDPTKIPDRLPDRFENYFDTSDADVVPIFKKIA